MRHPFLIFCLFSVLIVACGALTPEETWTDWLEDAWDCAKDHAFTVTEYFKKVGVIFRDAFEKIRNL